MNQRLEQLAQQATEDILGVKILNQQKFAELIVKDCIFIIDNYCETTPEIYGLPLEILEHFDMELADDLDMYEGED